MTKNICDYSKCPMPELEIEEDEYYEIKLRGETIWKLCSRVCIAGFFKGYLEYMETKE